MKSALLIFLAAVATATAELKCQHPEVNITQKWITLEDPCTDKMKAQVQVELTAAMTYLAMGAHFSRDTINRPGFAQMFFNSASEERQHAIKVIEYLVMRGEMTELSRLINNPLPIKKSWTSASEALKDALNLEIEVTGKINDIIKVCESSSSSAKSPPVNDYHLVDYLTTDFLDEQLKGQREIAGRISTLGKMMTSHGVLGEFLYDKKILEELK